MCALPLSQPRRFLRRYPSRLLPFRVTSIARFRIALRAVLSPVQDLQDTIINRVVDTLFGHLEPAWGNRPSRLQLPVHVADMELHVAGLLLREVHFAEPARALGAADLDVCPGAFQGRQEYSERALGMHTVCHGLHGWVGIPEFGIPGPGILGRRRFGGVVESGPAIGLAMSCEESRSGETHWDELNLHARPMPLDRIIVYDDTGNSSEIVAEESHAFTQLDVQEDISRWLVGAGNMGYLDKLSQLFRLAVADDK